MQYVNWRISGDLIFIVFLCWLCAYGIRHFVCALNFHAFLVAKQGLVKYDYIELHVMPVTHRKKYQQYCNAAKGMKN